MADQSHKDGIGDDDTKKPLFRALEAQVNLDEMETSVIESLCMKCRKNVSHVVCRGPRAVAAAIFFERERFCTYSVEAWTVEHFLLGKE